MHFETALPLACRIGSPDYMSPEVLGLSQKAEPVFGGPAYDGRAVDVWAIGVMLFVLVTGSYPFEVSIAQVAQTCKNHLTGDICFCVLISILFASSNPADTLHCSQIPSDQFIVSI